MQPENGQANDDVKENRSGVDGCGDVGGRTALPDGSDGFPADGSSILNVNNTYGKTFFILAAVPCQDGLWLYYERRGTARWHDSAIHGNGG